MKYKILVTATIQIFGGASVYGLPLNGKLPLSLCEKYLGNPVSIEGTKKVRAVFDSIVNRPKVFKFTQPETGSVVTSRLELRGNFFPAKIEQGLDGKTVTFSPNENTAGFFEWGGEKFVEATNPSSYMSDEGQEYMIPRAILPYKNTLRPEEGILNSPEGYYSHIPILKRIGSGWKFEGFLIKSRPDKHFYFEDPRFVGPIFDSKGLQHYFVGGTDYSRHVNGQSDLFVRNVMYPVEFKDGLMQPLAIDESTGKPKNGIFISPTPKKMADGWRGVDAKNGLMTQLDDGSIIVHTRFRIEPQDDPVYKALLEQYGDRVPKWKYAIQAFRFDSYEEFEVYNWDHALEDLLLPTLNPNTPRSQTRITPTTKLVLRDKDLKDFIPAEFRAQGKPLGLGNGARRIRLERTGNMLFASFNKNSKQFYVGEVPKTRQSPGKFILESGEVSYLAPDHQLGYFKDLDPTTKEDRGTKRVYSGMMSLYDHSAMNLKAVFANYIQPKKPHQVAGTGGVLDLDHAAYVMGAVLVPETAQSKRFLLRVTGGAGDAHSESFDIDVIKLLSEMSPGSSQWRSGQVYKPK